MLAVILLKHLVYEKRLKKPAELYGGVGGIVVRPDSTDHGDMAFFFLDQLREHFFLFLVD